MTLPDLGISSRDQGKPFWQLVAVYNDCFTDTVIIVGPDGKIVHSNRSAQVHTGYTNDELVGEDMKKLRPENNHDDQDELWKTFCKGWETAREKGKPFTTRMQEFSLLKKDGLQTPMRMQMTTMYDTKPEEFIVVLHICDVSASREAERVKENFLATVSHEMRTPLNGIIGLSDALMATEKVAGRKKHLGVMNNSGKNMMGLVKDMLELTAVQSKSVELHLAQVDPDILLGEVVEEIRNAVDKRGAPTLRKTVTLEFAPGGAAMIEADPDRCYHALKHIVDNACKFTPKGKVVVSTKSDPQGLLVSVKDTGIGIAEDALVRIFGAFEQEDDDHKLRKYEGLGVGLTVAHEVAKQHGGKVWATSVKGEGSEFFLRFPECASEAIERNKKLAAQKLNMKGRGGATQAGGGGGDEDEAENDVMEKVKRLATDEVLIMDADQTHAETLRGALQAAGMKVSIVADGFKALEHFGSGMPDAVIVDVLHNDGRMKGIQLIQELRKNYGEAIPIVGIGEPAKNGGTLAGLWDKRVHDLVDKPVKSDDDKRAFVNRVKAKIMSRFRVEVDFADRIQYETRLRVLPKSILNRMSAGQSLIADQIPSVTYVAARVHGFELLVSSIPTFQLVVLLNKITSVFEDLVVDFDMHPYNVQADCMEAVCGHDGNEGHAERAVRFAQSFVETIEGVKVGNTGEKLQVKVGVHTGSGFAGVLGGTKKAPKYAFFGDSVKMVAAVTFTGIPGMVHCTASTHDMIMADFDGSGLYHFAERGTMPGLKDDDPDVQTYLLKKTEEQNLDRFKTGSLTATSGGNAEAMEEAMDKISELEDQLAYLAGTKGIDMDKLQEQLKETNMISASAALQLVEPVENLVDMVLQCLGPEEGGGGEQKEHPLIGRIESLESEVHALGRQTEQAMRECRKASKMAKTTKVEEDVTLGVTKESAEKMADLLESIIASIVTATGCEDEGPKDGEHPMLGKIGALETEMNGLADILMDVEEQLEDIKGGGSAFKADGPSIIAGTEGNSAGQVLATDFAKLQALFNSGEPLKLTMDGAEFLGECLDDMIEAMWNATEAIQMKGSGKVHPVMATFQEWEATMQELMGVVNEVENNFNLLKVQGFGGSGQVGSAGGVAPGEATEFVTVVEGALEALEQQVGAGGDQGGNSGGLATQVAAVEQEVQEMTKVMANVEQQLTAAKEQIPLIGGAQGQGQSSGTSSAPAASTEEVKILREEVGRLKTQLAASGGGAGDLSHIGPFLPDSNAQAIIDMLNAQVMELRDQLVVAQGSVMASKASTAPPAPGTDQHRVQILHEELILTQQDMRHMQLDLQFHQEKLELFLRENTQLQAENRRLQNDVQILEASVQRTRNALYTRTGGAVDGAAFAPGGRNSEYGPGGGFEEFSADGGQPAMAANPYARRRRNMYLM
eukprot:CAMPEP_0204357878 /NCGR_PEP_ID=MMETSP0469-20131031/36086_1 /ASSEMBLY_ACC=CAM_ASM_000384 /TAXON_ID=2969 /ORGANISM="Oxyrrhis marina" /LENGTH=1410 /DNA_ID=CAMNT_0051345635 /DNA_START=38 /DNA_END=4270 /DNA_ORIENTATION=+